MQMRQATADVAIGCAADSQATGVAYALVRTGKRQTLMRVPFGCRPLAALHGRDVTYAATHAVAVRLLDRGLRRVQLMTTDQELVGDLDGRRNVPAPLTVPYVMLRCLLNRFGAARVMLADDERRCRDLEARARAEVSLDIAA